MQIYYEFSIHFVIHFFHLFKWVASSIRSVSSFLINYLWFVLPLARDPRQPVKGERLQGRLSDVYKNMMLVAGGSRLCAVLFAQILDVCEPSCVLKASSGSPSCRRAVRQERTRTRTRWHTKQADRRTKLSRRIYGHQSIQADVRSANRGAPPFPSASQVLRYVR